MIRKVQYAPEKLGPAPCVETTRDFLMSDKPLHMEARLEKQVGFKQTTRQACKYHNFLSFFVVCNVLCCRFIFFLQTYYHGEPINVSVKIRNDSNKNVRNIIISGKSESEHIDKLVDKRNKSVQEKKLFLLFKNVLFVHIKMIILSHAILQPCFSQHVSARL